MRNEATHLSEIRLYDAGLPIALYNRLYKAVVAIGNEKPDGKDTYSKTFWFERNAKPSNVAEEALVILEKWAAPATQCTGMEWWLGRLKRGKKLRFHFDRDLSLSRETGESVFPMLSSVYYLNHFESSPTVLLDQVPGADGKSKVPVKAKMSTSVMAIANHYLVFPGNLRHGVIPDVGKQDQDEPNEYRLTLLVNYWDRRPSAPVCCDYDGSVYSSSCMS